ncbi:hypothetical protein GCM10011393_33950 [Sphingopyxis bauzanensis]|nr:hypothetical protein GCM10011393_33950 [Sphingopyxis bauzanensis]
MHPCDFENRQTNAATRTFDMIVYKAGDNSAATKMRAVSGSHHPVRDFDTGDRDRL